MTKTVTPTKGMHMTIDSLIQELTQIREKAGHDLPVYVQEKGGFMVFRPSLKTEDHHGCRADGEATPVDRVVLQPVTQQFVPMQHGPAKSNRTW